MNNILANNIRKKIRKEASTFKGDSKLVFRLAGSVAILHQTVTSPTGNNFRLRLLQKCEKGLTMTEIEKLKDESEITELERHIHKLLMLKLIKEEEGNGIVYTRTALGEEAVNAVKELQRKLGKEESKNLFNAHLGKNSIRLFIKVYEQDRDFSNNDVVIKAELFEVTFDPLEIGRLSLFLPRSIEGLSAIDKLNSAGLLYYGEDNQIHFPPVKARSFFQFMRRLLVILQKIEQKIQET